MTRSDISAIRNAATALLPHLPEAGWLPHALNRKSDGNLDKPPCDGARTNDPRSWFTIDGALGTLVTSRDAAGIGFAIVKGLISLDFDHCRDEHTGELAEEVQVVLEQCKSFAYVTPSRTGIRIVGTNSAFQPIKGQKAVRWLPAGHKIEFFIGPTNHYNTFTSNIIPGYKMIRDISTETLEYLSCLDGGKDTDSEAPPASNPDPQRSIAAIKAALTVIPNATKDWDWWNRIGMAVWRSCGGRGEGLDAWHEWSAKNPANGGTDNCDDRWQNYFQSPPNKIGFGTLYYEARKVRPLFVPPFDPLPVTNGHDNSGTKDSRSNGTGDGTGAGTPGTDTLPPILDATQFMATFSMPDYLIDGVIQRGRLHAMTSPTGHGKTAVALFLACMMASAKNIGAIEVTQGNVLFLAGENPDDLCVRLHAACQSYGIPPGDLPIYVMPGNFPISPEAAEALKAKIDATGIQFSLIIGDSLAAYFPGDDENHNVQMGNYARNWRVLTTCAGRPAVMALAHPVKAAGRDNLLPRGGGAFLAEIDANLTLWAEGDRETTTLHWQGKIRGADFQPVTFALAPVTLTDKADAKGRLLVSVVAVLQTTEQADMAVKATVSNENVVLEWMRRAPGISIKDLATNIGWVSVSGTPHKGKVHRILKSLQALKLVKFWRGKWLITDAGIAELKQEKYDE